LASSSQIYGKTWPTTEAFFQAQKFHPHRPDLVERVRNASRPGIAKKIGTDKRNPLRKDWEEVKEDVMYTPQHL